MSLKPIENKKRVSEIKTGTHLVVISDMMFLRDEMKELKMINGFPAISVQFKDGFNNLHEQTYILDGGIKQKYFDNMLRAAQVPLDNGKPQKKNTIGKRLYISICECHYINDDQVVKNFDGSAKIEYYIFKVYPFIEGGKKPKVVGDPEMNSGIAQGDFITYKNESGDDASEKEIQNYLNKESAETYSKCESEQSEYKTEMSIQKQVTVTGYENINEPEEPKFEIEEVKSIDKMESNPPLQKVVVSKSMMEAIKKEAPELEDSIVEMPMFDIDDDEPKKLFDEKMTQEEKDYIAEQEIEQFDKLPIPNKVNPNNDPRMDETPTF